ncbi:MAG TPA: FHA domain-containing protein [Acidimicrobiales bacterium]|nr:FHA domain-containing protein [Acidimicrobiales bacterium]
MFCPRCGHRNPAGVNFCSSCGTALVTSAPDTSVSNVPVDDLSDGGQEDAAVGLLELPRGVGLLVVKRGSDVGVRFALDAAITKAGRHPESDIFLDDITVSRRHAEFVTSDQVTTVRDVGSLNGTYVNRERIEEARLSSGDEVQIGKFKLLYLVAAGE